ncbi:LLM class flavin-dependent oxidoreductase [Iamia sp. SCSIO 61187]|uniref:LLM class flavin-dependent oxidoreductase n=1 Tax=Iamia sp. SCSIO 61187 TaxID=2722752 RepID=UPI001C631374|nr:LLM class flavin-dependent oxidoreductase [Iamia sp. SCSIO 61187]
MALPKLSVLDLSIVGRGSTPALALESSRRLAQEAERLGFTRYWVAEHHNMPGIASSSPPVLIAHLAAHTTTLRLGSGGVMLPNHSPLVVAEQFGMLEALHPGRIDLGLGRAPGTDGLTAAALRRTNRFDAEEEFPRQLGELLAYFNGTFPDDHPFKAIHATPGRGYQPDVWLLGSSLYSAQLAGLLGLPFSFAHHFSGENTEAAVAAYRQAFDPSGALDQPYVMLGVNVLCAPTLDEARYLSGPGKLAMARLRTGNPDVYPTAEEAANHVYSPQEEATARSWGRHHVIGPPEAVRSGLLDLAERTGADELMITTMTHGFDERVRSYRLVAEAMEMADAPA